ncbi:MAG: hypothetical protein QOG15_1053 [Solirubrobacteraceae bacterium]|nr:hypothetical protein [Solirubrobacteraceae bacterium]
MRLGNRTSPIQRWSGRTASHHAPRCDPDCAALMLPSRWLHSESVPSAASAEHGSVASAAAAAAQPRDSVASRRARKVSAAASMA